MTRSFPRFALSIAFGLLLSACGGNTEDRTNTGGAGGTGASSGSGGGGASGGSGGASGGSGGASGGSGGATGGTGGSATGGSAGSGSGGAAGTGGSAASVICDTSTCGAGQYCCHPKCVGDGTACTGFALHCDGASDCPNGVCCASSAGVGFPVAQCSTSCDVSKAMIVCVLGVAGSCPPGMKCNITQQLPPEYGFCN